MTITLSDWQQIFKVLHDKVWNQSTAWRNEPCTWPQVKGINILLREGLMMDPSRECKLYVVKRIIGRDIESTNFLTKIEAHTLINILKDEKNSTEKEWKLSDDGHQLLELAELEYVEITYAPA